jgi:hypothetical protein
MRRTKARVDSWCRVKGAVTSVMVHGVISDNNGGCKGGEEETSEREGNKVPGVPDGRLVNHLGKFRRKTINRHRIPDVYSIFDS